MAGGTVKSLLVRLGIDSRALDTGLTKAEKQTKRVENQMAAMTAASKRAEAGMALQAQKAEVLARKQQILADVSKKAAIAFTAIAVAGAAVITKTTLLAARVETLGVVVRQVGKNAGYSEEQIDRFEKGVKDMGITTQAARSALARMAQAQIHWSNSSKLARIAQDAAVIGNMNSSESFEKLTYVLQTGNVRMGRTLGLNLNFQKSYEDMAAKIGTVAADLNEQQKIQARVNEVMRAGVGIQGAYEASMETAGKKMQSLTRIFEEIQLKVGNQFLPLFTQVIDKVTALGNAVLNMDPQLRSAIVIFGGIMTAVSGVVGALLGLVAILPAIKAGILALGVVINVSTGGILLLVGAIVSVVAALTAWRAAEGMQKDAAVKSAEEAAAAANSYYGYRKALEDVAKETGTLIINEAEYQKMMEGTRRQRLAAQRAIVLQSEAEWDAVEAAESSAAAQKFAALATIERLRETSPAFADYRYELEGVSAAELEAANAARILKDQLETVPEKVIASTQSFGDMGISISSMDIDIDDAIEKLREYLVWLTTEGPGIVSAIQRITDAVTSGTWTPEIADIALMGLESGGVAGMNEALGRTERFMTSGVRSAEGMASVVPEGVFGPSLAAPTAGAPIQVEIIAAAPDIPGLTSEAPLVVPDEPDMVTQAIHFLENGTVNMNRELDIQELKAVLSRLI